MFHVTILSIWGGYYDVLMTKYINMFNMFNIESIFSEEPLLYCLILEYCLSTVFE